MTRRIGVRESFIFVVAVIFLVGGTVSVFAASTICNQGVCVQTWQQDTAVPGVAPGYSYRTGENLSEGAPSVENFPIDFGQRCSLQVDGQVYGQPLILTNVKIGTITYSSVAYVVTQKDKVYAIQATPPSSGNTCNMLLEADLLQNNFQQNNPVMSPVNCMNVGGGTQSCQNTIGPNIGILGTPAIALDGPGNSTGTLYVLGYESVQ
jgi:hypothetical protein